jgi:hypothetical protein
MQKCSYGEKHFYEHFFQSLIEIANTQQITGWYNVYIQGISDVGQVCVRVRVKVRVSTKTQKISTY